MKRQCTISFLYFFASILFISGCTKSNESLFSQYLSDGGGSGTASIAITGYSPGYASLNIKHENQQSFLVSATGESSLSYAWTLDDAAVGTDSSSFTLDATLYAIGNKVLRVTVSDGVGTATQTWNIKINGSPVVDSFSPTTLAFKQNYSTSKDYSVTVSDPNSDSLTYTWKIDGQENILLAPDGSSPTTTVRYSPSSVDVGTHTVSVEVRDGAVSDAGTYTVTKTWNLAVNYFNTACNDMDNLSQTNKTCVYAGISSMGGGLNPDLFPSSFLWLPKHVHFDSNGSLFIVDASNHLIYYWNRTALPVTVLGYTVLANTAEVVAGVGSTAVGSATSSYARRSFLNSPNQVYFNGSSLFVSENTGASSVIRKIDSTGVISTLVSGAANCNEPQGLLNIGGNSGSLYVACRNSHKIKVINLTNNAISDFVGTGTNAAPVARVEALTTNIQEPWGLELDSSGNILFSENTGCRIRVVNMSAGVLNDYAGDASLDIGVGQQGVLLGSVTPTTCGYTAGTTTAARINGPKAMSIYGSSLYIPVATSTHGIGTLNLTTGSFSRTVGQGTAGYREGSFASAYFNNPYAVAAEPGTGFLYIADYSNLRLRRTTVSNAVELVGGTTYSSRVSAGPTTTNVQEERMNRPRHIVYDSVEKLTFYSDYSNARIRKIDQYGNVTTAVGSGVAGLGSEENEFPDISTMNGPGALVLIDSTSTYGGHLVWTDVNNHRVRIWNRSSSAIQKFGMQIDANRVATIAGDGTTAIFSSPEGVAYDGTNLYVSSTGHHCIKMIDSTGAVSVAAGTCGAAGNVEDMAASAKFSSPRGLAFYSSSTNQKGLFIADQNNSRVKFYKISGGTPLNIAGTVIADGYVDSIACKGNDHFDEVGPNNALCNSVYDVKVVGTKFCFTNYGYHNVRCSEISTGALYTVLGAPQGTLANTLASFPGSSFTASDQNGIAASIRISASQSLPDINSAMAVINGPLGIATVDSNTILVSEWQTSLIRKVKIKPVLSDP